MIMNSTTLYKLMILYMLKQISVPLQSEQIAEFFINSGYADYFSVCEALGDMIDNNYLRSSTLYNATEYYITPLGEETFKLLEAGLPFAIKNDIKKFMKENKYDFKMNNEVTASIHTSSNGDYYAKLNAMDGQTPIINIDIACVNEEQAIRLCNHWRNAGYDIYKYIIDTSNGK